MLDLLPLRTTQVYDKLADALHVSGHTLLADFLREEDRSKQPLDTKDLFRRLPFLAKNMKEQEKKDMENYMIEKIQSAILASTWQWDTKEKDKALVAKQEQIEQSHVHEQEMQKKHAQVLEAERRAKEAREETLAMKAEMKALTHGSIKMQHQLKEKVDTQMRFSVANDNIAMRINNRLQMAEGTLKEVHEKLNTVVSLSPHQTDKELMLKAENPYFFLPEDVDLFISQFKKLLVVQLKYEDLLEERKYILEHLGLADNHQHDDDSEQASLLKAYNEFLSKNDEQIQALKGQVAKYGDLLEDATKTKEQEDRKIAAAGTVWQNAIMSVMRKQLQDLKGTLRKKDTTKGIKEADIGKLKEKMAVMEQSLKDKTQELELATQRHVNIVEFTNGAASADSLDGSTPGGGGGGGGGGVGLAPAAPSPKPRGTGTALPPLRSSKTGSSPRPGIARPRAQFGVPRGIVVESDGPMTMYPAGLTTMQLRVHREDTAAGGERAATGNARPQMGSGLGDLKAMHAHTKYPPSRGGGMSMNLDASNHLGNKHMHPSSTPKRKMPVKVK
ncbi:hypothetical protein V1264_010386 [Littorina saxatilis]|uniref:Uncharacterized protein n=2 Tax=Littorina saxatilis TaxID=31220 RepID=A0AAN9APH0_9CAEN